MPREAELSVARQVLRAHQRGADGGPPYCGGWSQLVLLPTALSSLIYKTVCQQCLEELNVLGGAT